MADGPRRADEPEAQADGRVARLDGITGGAGGAEPAHTPVARLAGLDPPDAARAAPVAAFTAGDAAAEPAPVALFDAGELGGDRADVTVAELGAAGSRRRGSPGGRTARDGRATEKTGVGRRRRTERPSSAPVTDHVPSADPIDDPAEHPGSVKEIADPSRRERTNGGRARRGAGAWGGGARSERAGDRGELDPDADPVAVAREICLRLLTDRARTRQELAQALRRRGVPDDVAGSVLERFDEVGLIDDAAFAGQWVRSRHAHRGLARRAIAMELRRKGVSDDDAGEALAEVDAESEERRARELVDRKLRSMAVGTTEQQTVAGRRLVGMLARKGYGAGTAYRVVKEALAERGAELDELGDSEVPDD
jgi:regulatory protein